MSMQRVAAVAHTTNQTPTKRSNVANAHHVSKWTVVSIVCLVVLAASSGLALYFGIAAPNPTGTYASYVAYAMIVVLIVLAVMGKRLQHRTVVVHTAKPKLTQKSITTGAGSVDMVSGR